MKTNKKQLLAFLKDKSLYLLLVLLVIVFSIFTKGFLSWGNLVNILKRVSITALISVGMLFVIITGGINISAGSLTVLSSVFIAASMVNGRFSFGMILLLILLSIAIGSCLGFVIAKFNVPAIIATLALSSIIRGGLMIFTGGFTVDGNQNGLIRFLSRSSLFRIPNYFWIVPIVYFVAWILLKKTKFGKYVYAIGGNEEVCRQSGIPVIRTKVLVYVFATVVCFIGGVMLFARLGVGQPTALSNTDLDCIAAVVLGGASLSGGKGKLLNTFIGALTLGLLINGLNYLNLVTYWQYVVQGLVILFAALLHSERK